MWGGTVVAACFIAFRFYVRLTAFQKLYLDDYMVLTAWILLLVTSAIWQSQLPALYLLYQLAGGTVAPTLDVLAKEQIPMHSQVPTVMFYYIGLWLVKFSFLIFFRRLGANVRGQKIWWWCVFTFTLLTLGSAVGVMSWGCSLGPLEYIFSESAASSAYTTLFYILAVDILTDGLILSIPIIMLWRVRISFRRKLALVGIFSLTVIVIVLAIIRVSLVYNPDKNVDATWLYMWSNIEIQVSLIVSCLASFRQLFVKSNDPGIPKITNQSSTWWHGPLSMFSSSNTHRSVSSESGSKDKIMPMDTIYVTRNMGQSVATGDDSRTPQAYVNNTCYREGAEMV
ncbi:MAG: hypothetical protein LQ340_000729 [Diploschistes diacapsis]|nr:MAG: hypothetical protein LQ340_000729 [Diploschistes diacapsis]